MYKVINSVRAVCAKIAQRRNIVTIRRPYGARTSRFHLRDTAAKSLSMDGRTSDNNSFKCAMFGANVVADALGSTVGVGVFLTSSYRFASRTCSNSATSISIYAILSDGDLIVSLPVPRIPSSLHFCRKILRFFMFVRIYRHFFMFEHVFLSAFQNHVTNGFQVLT